MYYNMIIFQTLVPQITIHHPVSLILVNIVSCDQLIFDQQRYLSWLYFHRH